RILEKLFVTHDGEHHFNRIDVIWRPAFIVGKYASAKRTGPGVSLREGYRSGHPVFIGHIIVIEESDQTSSPARDCPLYGIRLSRHRLVFISQHTSNRPIGLVRQYYVHSPVPTIVVHDDDFPLEILDILLPA